jgi:hypothetical protein
MISEYYSDCFSKSVIVQGRTSNFTIIDTTTCSNFAECTQKLCQMTNNSMVDMVALFFESSHTDQIYYYDNKFVYLLASIIILLLIILFILAGLLCIFRLKISNMRDMAYEKVNKIHHVEYHENELK